MNICNYQFVSSSRTTIVIFFCFCFKQGYGEGKGIELRDKNLLFLEFPGNEVLSFYDIKDVLDQYDCTGCKIMLMKNIRVSCNISAY